MGGNKLVQQVYKIERKTQTQTQTQATIVVTILVILYIALFSVGTSLNLGSLFGGKLHWLFATEHIQIFSLVFVLFTILFGWIKIRVNNSTDILWLFLPFLLAALSLISQLIETQVTSFESIIQTSGHVFIIYFLICFAKQSNFSFQTNFVANFIVIIGVFEATLGIVQHISRTPFFDPQKLNAIYFLNGLSSSNILDLGYNASVRAFGTFDSGLTLGIFLIFTFAIMIEFSSIKKVFKTLITVTYLIAIYFTLTRNVYVGVISFLLLYFFLNHNIRPAYFSWLYFFVTVISASLFWLTGLLDWMVSIASSINITTFESRFVFLKQVIAEIPDGLHFFLGTNITSVSGVPIDSSAITIIAQFGLLFVIFVFLLQISIFKGTVTKKMYKFPALGAFLFLFPIMGASNNVVQSFLMASAIIALFNQNSSEDDN